MATHIFSPHNEFGKALVPVGMQKTKAKVLEAEFIDISWLDTVNDYEQGKAGAENIPNAGRSHPQAGGKMDR